MKILSLLCIVFALTACNSEKSNASEINPGAAQSPKVPSTATPVYYVGGQSINLTTQAECYVELRFSEDKKFAEVRAILTNPHELAEDPDHAVVGLGMIELEQKFLGGTLKTNGYYFEDKTPLALVKQLLIFGNASNPIVELRAALLHGGHHDPVNCTQLAEAQGQQLSDIQEMYTHFEEYKEHLSGEHEGHDHE